MATSITGTSTAGFRGGGRPCRPSPASTPPSRSGRSSPTSSRCGTEPRKEGIVSRRGFLLAFAAFVAAAIGPDRLFLRPEGVRAAETDGDEEQDEGDREGTRDEQETREGDAKRQGAEQDGREQPEADEDDVDAIVTIFGPSTQAARAATTRVPIVFCPVADPVAAKFVASSEAPGGNLTGVASADAEASRRRLIAFRQVLPELRRLAVLFDPDFPPDRVQVANLEQTARSGGITLLTRTVADGDAAVAALQALGQSEVEAVLILKEALLRHAAEEIGRVAIARKFPIVVGGPDLVALSGGVAAVGPSQQHPGQLCGAMTARILHGAKAASLAVEHPVIEVLVNLKVAGRLGLVIPEGAVEQAVRVIR